VGYVCSVVVAEKMDIDWCYFITLTQFLVRYIGFFTILFSISLSSTVLIFCMYCLFCIVSFSTVRFQVIALMKLTMYAGFLCFWDSLIDSIAIIVSAIGSLLMMFFSE